MRHESTAAKADLSHLPFEERMAYYKRKYEADEARIAEGNASSGGSPERSDRDRRPAGGERGRPAPRRDRPRQDDSRRDARADGRRDGRPEAARSDGRADGKAAPSRQGSGRQGPRRDDQARRDRTGSAGRGRGGQGQAKAGGGAAGPAKNAGATAPKAEKKAGIVSRLLGLFKKKES